MSDLSRIQDAGLDAVQRAREPATVLRHGASGAMGVAVGAADPPAAPWKVVGILPPLYPEWLGDRSFQEVHGCRFAYVVGEMARGIATADMVIAAARSGLFGFFGSAGLGPQRVEVAVNAIRAALGPEASSWGANLIHAPNDPALEAAHVDLFQRLGVTRVSASAFMALTPTVVRLAAHGLRRLPDGTIARRTHIFAKVSRVEVASAFMTPPPAAMLQALVAQGALTAEEAELAATLPVAEDITVEADSGGHTDNRALTVLMPAIMAARDAAATAHGRRIRLGAGGGLGTPNAVAAAFALGADYVVTGSINQAAVESAQPLAVRQLLAEQGIADVTMAPAADMFEQGVKVQVAKRGTMFAFRAARLFDLYRTHDSLDDIPAAERGALERDIFRTSLDAVWQSTREHFQARDLAEIARAERDPKHRMALVFRWYLFHAARWPVDGDDSRALDWQIWCGPAMGAFNAWARGTILEPVENRTVQQISWNLMEGAAAVTRAQQLRTFGVAVPAAAFTWVPRRILG